MSKYIYALLLLACAFSLTDCEAPAHQPRPYSKKKMAVKKKEQDAFRLNWTSNHLKGRIKNFWVFTYGGPAADTSTTGYELKEYLQYDTTGNQVERTIYNAQRFDSRNIYRYDATNKCIEIINYAEDGSFNYRTYRIFDSTGNLLEKGELHKDSAQIGAYSKIVNAYDEHGGCVKTTKGYDVAVFTNIYDEDDDILITQKMVYNKQPSGRVKYKYDDNGYLLERESILENGLLDSKTINTYNGHHQLIQVIVENMQEGGSTETFAYDSLGSILHYQKIINQPSHPRMASAHNSYEYDKAGNWTKCTVRNAAGKITGTMIRKITYY